MTAPRIGYYDWDRGREAMLRFGPEGGPTVLAALPLFEEANRTRASLIAVLRRLAERGIASALPDMPGAGESLVATEAATLAAWRQAFAAAARAVPCPVHVVCWRSGALIDVEAVVASRWRLSPVSGAETVRDLRRVQAASRGSLFAGNPLSEAMLAELATATYLPGRTVRLDTDPREANLKLRGRPLWRAAEPGTDPALEAALADDIAQWIVRCGG
jgi:pimeloyl-ACP methyl ester carboxylesterase